MTSPEGNIVLKFKIQISRNLEDFKTSDFQPYASCLMFYRTSITKIDYENFLGNPDFNFQVHHSQVSF